MVKVDLKKIANSVGKDVPPLDMGVQVTDGMGGPTSKDEGNVMSLLKKYSKTVWSIIMAIGIVAGYTGNEYMGGSTPQPAPANNTEVVEKIDSAVLDLKTYIDGKFTGVRITVLDNGENN